MISHGRIYDQLPAGRKQRPGNIPHKTDLLDTPKVPGIDAIKGDTFLHPMGLYPRHFLRQIADRRSGEAACMTG